MKKSTSLFFISFGLLFSFSAQAQKKTFAAKAPTPLKGVTVGFGIGYNCLFEKPNEYFLSTDPQHTLHLQELSRSNFVISTVLSIKLGKPAVQEQTVDGITHKRIVDLNSLNQAVSNQIVADVSANRVVSPSTQYFEQTGKCRWALNLGLNLIDVSSDASFNKSIDGGIGLGYILNEFTQLSLFLDMVRYRQLRDYFVENYTGKPIPNGNDVFNALDEKDNNLFHNKYFAGLSLKLVLTINNQ